MKYLGQAENVQKKQLRTLKTTFKKKQLSGYSNTSEQMEIVSSEENPESQSNPENKPGLSNSPL